ncbi:hypothetical protein SAMN04487962_11267 [Marinobacter segnicrescens]|uniref:Uncharacterized protein n=1 Tax=Marinobacter segnicrescens TaxID=430453 RepID=A0A1I0FDV2_9GAMM|nr:hypothetical protein SAMN04487962_11267 [Marinobacter segnicrescens]
MADLADDDPGCHEVPAAVAESDGEWPAAVMVAGIVRAQWIVLGGGYQLFKGAAVDFTVAVTQHQRQVGVRSCYLAVLADCQNGRHTFAGTRAVAADDELIHVRVLL